MKKLIAGMLLTTVIGLVGCNDKSPPGGPGATGARRDPGVGLTQPDNTFSLDAPNLETNIKQGETKTITIDIDRGKNFDQDVQLDFTNVPKGVRITPASRDIRANAQDVQVTIEAAKDAALGKHTITVTGTPARQGTKTSTTFQIEVQKAD